MHFTGEMKPAFKFLFFLICSPLRTRSISASLRKRRQNTTGCHQLRKQAVSVRVGVGAGCWRLQGGKESTNKVGA